MADAKTLSLDGTAYNIKDATARSDLNNKAAKTEAIKNITRSGTTFTATRCDNTTFTFTQQDNNTTTGTTYNAGSVPANTTFGTNGSIKNVYDSLKGAFITENRTLTFAAGTTYGYFNANLHPGYTPIACVGAGSFAGYFPAGIAVVSSTQYAVFINTAPSANTNLTFTILWVKQSYFV